MVEAQIFISYRRDDAAGYARAVYDELARQFGDARVFIDVDDIGPGLAFADVIKQAVGGSKVLLVLIGPRWRGVRDGLPPRIDDADDFVRIEVESALAAGMRVIPVLLDGAAMPTAAQLPEALRPLAGRNALAVDNTRFAADVARLVASLRDVLGETPAPALPAAPRRRMPGVAIAAAALAGVLALAGLWLVLRPPAVPARPPVNGAWQAEVVYDWPNANYVERFEFSGTGSELLGSASFLRVPRGLHEGSVAADGLRFVTRTTEVSGDASQATVHRYRGHLVDGEIRFVMQTEGGSSTHVPVEFVARRVAAR